MKQTIKNTKASEGDIGMNPGLGLLGTVGRNQRWGRLFMMLSLAIGVSGAIYMHHRGYYSVAETLTFLRWHPLMAPLLFVALYALLSILLLPTLPLNLAAGVLWGWWLGTLLTLLGVVFGASCAFFIARYIGRDFVARRLQGKHWGMLWRVIEAKGWKAVAFARINPIFPSAPMNYFFGLTSISFWPYFFSTLLFILPPSLFFSVLGDSIGGVVLNGAAREVVNSILLASAAITGLVALRLSIKHFVGKNSSQ